MCLSQSRMHFHQHEVDLCKVGVCQLLLNLFPKKTVKRCQMCFSYITEDYICLSFWLLVWQNKTLEDVTMGSEKLWWAFVSTYFGILSTEQFKSANLSACYTRNTVAHIAPMIGVWITLTSVADIGRTEKAEKKLGWCELANRLTNKSSCERFHNHIKIFHTGASVNVDEIQ